MFFDACKQELIYCYLVGKQILILLYGIARNILSYNLYDQLSADKGGENLMICVTIDKCWCGMGIIFVFYFSKNILSLIPTQYIVVNLL